MRRRRGSPGRGGAALSGPPDARLKASRHSLPALVAAAALLIAGSSMVIVHVRRAAFVARLPTLPDLSHQPEALRAHLTEADRRARAAGRSADAVGRLGLAYHADMFYEQADRCYELAEALSGAWTWSYYRALVREAQGDSKGVEPELRRVVAMTAEFSPAWWRLGEVEFKTARYEAAEDAWRHAMSLPEPVRPAAKDGAPPRTINAPISAYAALGLARIALTKGDPDRARRDLESLTASAPKFGPAFRLLGNAYSALDREVEAAKATRMADELPAYDPYVDPTFDALVRESRSSTFLLQQAAAADVSTNAAWREHLIRRALEVDPNNADALFELASLLRVLRRYEEALSLLERHRRQAPGDFQVFADIGRCLSGLRRYPEAEAVLRQALSGLDDANTRYDLGLVLDRTGRIAEAIGEYQRALERNPNHREALNNLGVAFARQGRTREAARQFERLVAVDPDNADAHSNLGAMQQSLGDRNGAVREFRVALQLNPNHPVAREGLRTLDAR